LVEERQAAVQRLQEEVAVRDRHLALLNEAVAVRDRQLADREQDGGAVRASGALVVETPGADLLRVAASRAVSRARRLLHRRPVKIVRD